MLLMRRAVTVCALALLGGIAVAQEIAAPALPDIDLFANSKASWFQRDGLKPYYFVVHRPALLVFWRADDADTMERIVPAMVALAESKEDELAVLFVERSQMPYTEMLRAVAIHRWLGSPALWTSDAPAGAEQLDAPCFVLLGRDQRPVLTGHPLTDQQKLDVAIRDAFEECRFGPADLPAEARAARQALQEGRYAKAFGLPAAADRARARGDAAEADVLEAQARWIEDDIQLRFDSLHGMLFRGTSAAALPRLQALSKALEALPNDNRLREVVTSSLAAWDCGEALVEVQASAKLMKLQGALYAKGPSDSLAASLRKFAAAEPGTHAAERATFLASIAAP